MDNYYGYQPQAYQSNIQPNMYYQPTQTTPIASQRSWQQYYQLPQAVNNAPQYQQIPQPINNSMVWVQGEAGAKSYVLPNNTTLPLWDSEAQVIYIKSVDANGKPSMTILDYVDRNAPVQQEETFEIQYATKDQIDQLTKELASVNDKLKSIEQYATKDQFNYLDGHLNDLGSQIEEIENRIMSFGKPQQNNNRKGNNNG